jgi:hypothetical protein
MSKTPRLVYLLTHTPVHIHRPLQVGFVAKNQWSDEIFAKYLIGVEENRQGGCNRHHISKRDIERLGFMPPCGARFEMVELDLNWLPTYVEPHEDFENISMEEVYTGKKPEMR